MHYEASVMVKAPVQKTYSAYVEFESMPKWSKQASAVRILKKEGDTVQLEVEAPSSGGNRRVTTELRLCPFESVESGGETRFTRTRRTVSFAAAPEGTTVTASLEISMKGIWGLILRTRGKAEVEAAASDELASFARYVEGLS